MTASIIFDISSDGAVRVSGYAPEEARTWELLARGLSGYFHAHGLTGPENYQQRLDAFYALLDRYGISREGVESGLIQ